MKKFALLFFFILVPLNLHATIDLPTCNQCLQNKADLLLAKLAKAEDDFIKFRWSEHQIRRIYYEPLWQSRVDQKDPLNQARRTHGKKEEEKWLGLVQIYQKRSETYANHWVKTLQDLTESARYFRSCHSEAVFFDCAQEKLKLFLDQAKELLKAFDPIYENDRLYLKQVALVAGSKSGVYPEDTVENPGNHTEFYDRFEQKNAPQHFLEDAKIMQLFDDLRQKIDEIKTCNCCYLAVSPDTLAPETSEGLSSKDLHE